MTMKHIALILCFFSMKLFAGGMLRENFESTRAAGMGNAFVALADDSNALWQNPAGLAFINGTHFNLVDATLSVDSLDTLNRIKNLLFAGDAQNFLRLDQQYQAFNFKPVFTTKYLGFSFYNNMVGWFDTKYLDVLGFSIPSVDVYAFNDTALIGGFGVPVTNYFSFGASARLMLRTAIDANLSAQDLVAQLGLASINEFDSAIYDSLKKLAGNGYGIGLNIGTMAKIPLGGKGAPMLQLAGVVEDVGQTGFTSLTTSLPAPPAIKTNYIGGAAILWPWGPNSRVSFSAELRHLELPVGINKKAHMGIEYKHKYYGLRVGFEQGYPTAGFSWELLPHTRVHFATYAKELGDSFRERSQRWYMLQLVIGFRPL